MRKFFLILVLLLAATAAHAADSASSSQWRAKVAGTLPLLGHRNWILVVDSAYPLQTSPGVETIETNESQLSVVRSVLDAINASIHVRPVVYMDAELPFVTDDDALGVSVYRTKIDGLLRDYNVRSLPHDRIIANIDEAGKTFHVLVLKTNMTIPYTSVFFRLDCKYWSADAEQRLRTKMGAAK